MVSLLDSKVDKLSGVARRLKGDKLKLSIYNAAEKQAAKLETSKKKIVDLKEADEFNRSKTMAAVGSAASLVTEATTIIKASKD